MSTKELTVTVVGWAASTPREVIGDGVPYTSFRVGTTPRFYDNRIGAWADGRTEWITVKAFRDVAFNVAASIRKGEPVLAHGRLRTEEWVSETGPRTALVLEATALGHDLTRGRSSFARTLHVAGTAGAAGTESDGGSPNANLSGGPERFAGEHGGRLDVDDPWASDGLQDAGADPGQETFEGADGGTEARLPTP